MDEIDIWKAINDVIQENKIYKQQLDEANEQLEYLRSGKYLNQIKWERDMLEKQYLDKTEQNIFEQQSQAITDLQQQLDEIKTELKDNIEYWKPKTIINNDNLENFSLYEVNGFARYDALNNFYLNIILKKTKEGE